MSVNIRFEHKPSEVEVLTGPFSYAEITYDALRVDDGRIIAEMDKLTQLWCFVDEFSPNSTTREFTDVCVYAAGD